MGASPSVTVVVVTEDATVDVTPPAGAAGAIADVPLSFVGVVVGVVVAVAAVVVLVVVAVV
jgi:hypothetical protein